MIIKRRPKKYDEFVSCIGDVIASVPFWVVQAEELITEPESTGLDKKNWVLGQLLNQVETRLKRDLTSNEELYAFKTFSHYIEKILSCPTKKGGLGREDE